MFKIIKLILGLVGIKKEEIMISHTIRFGGSPITVIPPDKENVGISKMRFVKRLLPVASNIEKINKIPARFIVAQAAHESNWGNSELTRLACNLFGITADTEWLKLNKPSYSIATKEYSKYPPEKIKYWSRVGDILEKKPDGRGGSILKVVVAFRKYANWDESIQDWAQHISSNERYRKVIETAYTNDPRAYYGALKDAGYATDPNYDKKLVAVYEKVKEVESIA